MSEQLRFRFNIFFLSYVILWRMIQVFFLGGFDGAGRINLVLMTCAVILNFRDFVRSPRYMLVWGVWVVYVVICSKIKGFYSETNTFTNWYPKALIFPFVSMLVAYQAVKYNHVKTLKYIFRRTTRKCLHQCMGTIWNYLLQKKEWIISQAYLILGTVKEMWLKEINVKVFNDT